MERGAAKKALREIATSASMKRAAPLLTEEQRERLGITVTVYPGAAGPSADSEAYGRATDQDKELPGDEDEED